MKSRKQEAVQSRSIMDAIAGIGTFKMFSKALKEIKLDTTLGSGGQYTVFAPVDAAFDDMARETLKELFSDKERLDKITRYHIVPERLTTEDMPEHRTARTLQGESLAIDTGEGIIKVNNSKVMNADIACNNGVLHVIDKLLVPRPKIT